MRTTLGMSILATTLLALSTGFALAQNTGASERVQIAESKGRTVIGTPPHPSTTGRAHRSPTAATKGANKPGFCPPGQRKKPGKGSAFNC